MIAALFNSSKTVSYQLPAEMPEGIWSVCHLRILGSGWAELAGVPIPCTKATVTRLQELGAGRVSIANSGNRLCVVRFQAKQGVLEQLSTSFPSACKVA